MDIETRDIDVVDVPVKLIKIGERLIPEESNWRPKRSFFNSLWGHDLYPNREEEENIYESNKMY